MKKYIHRKHPHLKIYIFLVLFFTVGFALGCISTNLFALSSSDDSNNNEMQAQKETFDASNYENKPNVNINVIKDLKKGYNVRILTNNFKFNPSMASLEHIDSEGYALIYINDIEINRIYGDWYHLPELNHGDIVKVTLNTNDHRLYMVNHEPIESIYVLE